MKNKNLLVNREDKIAFISFNRPKVLNALNSETLEELIEVLKELNTSTHIKAVIITGEGEKSFIAGADIAEMKDMNSIQALEFMKRGHMAFSYLERMEIPVIAAVNGFALGGGAELTLACDFTIASEQATFGFPEVSLGLFPGFGGTQRLPRLIGKAKAKELIYTGRMIPSSEAYEMGLVNMVVSKNALMDETRKVALKITKNDSYAIALAKTAIDRGFDLDLDNGCAFERNTIALCFSSEGQKKRMKAFLEKQNR